MVNTQVDMVQFELAKGQMVFLGWPDDGGSEMVFLTPEQVKLLRFLQENEYLHDDLICNIVDKIERP